jgi:hypothetical protein
MPGIKSAVAFVAMLIIPGAVAAAPVTEADRKQVLAAASLRWYP